MNIASFVRHAAMAHPQRTAVSVGHRPFADYRTLGARTRAMAGALRARGLGPGDCVALALSNCPQFFECLFGIWHAGMVAVPINAKLHRSEFAYIFDHSRAGLCIATPELGDTLAGLDGEIDSLNGIVFTDDHEYRAMSTAEGIDMVRTEVSDPAWLFYTSGTTGRPKGATLTHRSLLAMTLAYFADIDAVAPGDHMILAAPVSHGAGLYSLSHVAKAAHNIIPESGHFDVDEIVAIANARQNVSFFAAPTMITRLLGRSNAAQMGGLKTIVYGGGPMYVSDLEQAIDLWGPRLMQLYGQGESPMTITGLSQAYHGMSDHPRYRDWLASVGYPRTGVEVRIVGDNDEDLDFGEPGEILVRGDVLMTGYWDNPKATADTLRGGWLHTGDVGVMDADGLLTLKDRTKDMIISGGSNIYPREVEEILLRHKGVLEVSVVGHPHPEWGEEVVAFVVEREGMQVSDEELDRMCLDHIARFKRPKRYPSRGRFAEEQLWQDFKDCVARATDSRGETMRKVSIVGVDSTPFARHDDIAIDDLAAQSARAAIVQAGIEPQRIGALYLGNFVSGMLTGQEVLAGLVGEAIGLGNVPCTKVEGACASGGIAFRHACLAVAAGITDAAIAVGVEKMTHASNPRITESLNSAMDNRADAASGLTFPGLFGMAYRLHAARYGTTRDQVSSVVVKNKRNGLANPLAQMGAQLTLDDVSTSKPIADPLRLFDCCPASDGASAVVVVAREIAHQFSTQPIDVRASVQTRGAARIAGHLDLCTFDATASAAKMAYEQAGITAAELDFVELHDCFSIAEIIDSEDLGVVPRGAGGGYAAEGRTGPSGDIPINVSGGLLSKGHPVGATGLSQIYESVLQLRGAHPNPIRDAGIGLTHNLGGTGVACTVNILARPDA